MAYYSLPHIHYMHLIWFPPHVHCNSSISCKFSCIKRLNNSFLLVVPLTGREPTTNPRRGSQAKGAFRKVSNNNQWYLRTDARKLQGQPTVEEWEQWVSKTAFVILLTCTLHIGGVCVWVVNTLNSRSGGPGPKPCQLCCFLRQETLLHFVSLHPGV